MDVSSTRLDDVTLVLLSFRLVQLDGQTLAYAVCVRCLKPVSYKAREGTGGLHRHPCSKAAAASGFLPNGSLPPIAIHPLLAGVTTTTSSLPSSSSSTSCNASSTAGASSSSSSKRKDSQTYSHHQHHLRGSSSGISSKGSSLSSPSSSSPSLSPPATAVPDQISSSSSAGIVTGKRSNNHHNHNNHSNNNNLGPSLRQSSSSTSTTSSSRSHPKATSFSPPTSSSSQSHNNSNSMTSNHKINSSNNGSHKNSIFPRHHPGMHDNSSLTSSAMAAALNGNSSLSSLSSIMNPFLMSSLTGQQFNSNFIYSNGSLKTDCQAMLMLSDSKSPSFHPVTEQMTDLYERSVLLDLTLIAKNGSLKVHKLAIAAASIVFEEALTSYNNNSWSPSPESGVASASGSRTQSQDDAGSPAPNSPVNACPSSTVEELDLKDYDLTSVRAMVEFIYYGELNDTDLSVPEVMRLAEYYEIRALKFACAQRMYRNLSPENAIEYLAVAEKCKCEELKTLIPTFITENASRVTSTDAWRETFRDRSDLVANLLGVTATDLSMTKKRKNS